MLIEIKLTYLAVYSCSYLLAISDTNIKIKKTIFTILNLESYIVKIHIMIIIYVVD